MRAIVFAGANINDYAFCKKYIEENSKIICCDSGLRHAKNMGIMPNVIVGDFDSVDEETFGFYKNKNIETITLPTHKDETDLEIGIDIAIEKGCEEIIIIGGIGSRSDHTMANFHYLLYLLKKGIKAKLVNENNEVILIDDYIEINGKKGDLVSLIPLSMEVEGITTKGLEYPLENARLALDDRLIAVSNVMLGEKASVKIASGYIYVMRCTD